MTEMMKATSEFYPVKLLSKRQAPNYCVTSVQLLLVIKKPKDYHLPVSTAFADGSAKSKAVLPSVFRMVGSAPCCNSTTKNDKVFHEKTILQDKVYETYHYCNLQAAKETS